MEDPKDGILCTNRCQICSHTTYIRESSGQGGRKTCRLKGFSTQPRIVQEQGIQYRSWIGDRGFPATLLSSSGGLSTTIRGHGVTITIQGDVDAVHNISRVAYDVFHHPVIQSEVCYGNSTTTSDEHHA
ncbi:RNA silencing suppressor [Elderberry aureusvirus 1]|uniref:RNA silencing suppressor n=1 Tax=Elderberry aureusvirus 1 TaxID=2304214 RepID=A0A346LQY8_9TOMB|nr:RNA silencing suppressor [Elderberry aureusvirus 1]AXP98762.1 RNA silencing suppressor [Elderberry aureusvirus 1]